MLGMLGQINACQVKHYAVFRASSQRIHRVWQMRLKVQKTAIVTKWRFMYRYGISYRMHELCELRYSTLCTSRWYYV